VVNGRLYGYSQPIIIYNSARTVSIEERLDYWKRLLGITDYKLLENYQISGLLDMTSGVKLELNLL
jgi:hypothetical protein